MTDIYALVDETGTPRYVGQTTMGCRARFNRHISSAWGTRAQRPLEEWLRSCPLASVIPLELAPENPDEAERRWIKQMRDNGLDLLNVYEGGRKTPTGYQHSEEARARISAARRGKPLSSDHRRKLSEAHTGVSLGEGHRRAIARGGKGLIRSEETRARLSASKRGDLNPMSARRRAERAAEGGGAL